MLSFNKAAPRRRTPKRRPSDSELILLCVMVLVCCAAQELNAQTSSQPAERHAYNIELKIDLPRPRTLEVMNTESFGTYVRRIRTGLNAGGGIE